MKTNKERKLRKTTKNTTKSRTNIYKKPQLPFPSNFSMCVKLLEEEWKGYNDEWFRIISKESLDISKFQIIGGGVKNNLDNFHITEERWNNLKSLGKSINLNYNLYTDFDYRIHVETLRILTGYDLFDILYEGEIRIHNELFDTGEITRQMYNKVCTQMWGKVVKNRKFDITTMELKDFNLN